MYYEPEDIIHHGLKASFIWERDEERLYKIQKELGYSVDIVWQSDYMYDKKEVMRIIESQILWDSCNF